MTDIPEDVLEAATEALDEVVLFASRANKINAIARALMTDRAAQAERMARLEEALRPFAKCADELDGDDDIPRAPDGEWAKFRLLTDDYRRARRALSQEGSEPS